MRKLLIHAVQTVDCLVVSAHRHRLEYDVTGDGTMLRLSTMPRVTAQLSCRNPATLSVPCPVSFDTQSSSVFVRCRRCALFFFSLLVWSFPPSACSSLLCLLLAPTGSFRFALVSFLASGLLLCFPLFPLLSFASWHRPGHRLVARAFVSFLVLCFLL